MNYIDYIASTSEENARRATLEAVLKFEEYLKSIDLDIAEDVNPQPRYSPYDEPWIELPWEHRESPQVEQPESRYNQADQALNLCLGDVAEHDFTVIHYASITYHHCRRCGHEHILD